ncbi:uncharacterized protein EKO05_0002568 [Ascochyta rabiei]|uniref:uncharacterized protein n=1 Tax=Didymella rabiei TaxID=5454 RepID=UPI001900CC56|nr:uncharacterized protein EKO05_0002568 [Ascochyta rabiei]UPX11990.1 hypothetical protein EKO05_0002568 [Ascochyta rabiei]
MFGRLRVILLSASALCQLSGAAPADPTITTAAVLPRQNSDNFIGYLELNSTWNSFDCDPGLTWFQSGQYAQCCPATRPSCYAATACFGGSQIYTYPDRSSVRTIACTANYGNAKVSICNTIYIYENTQDSNPKTNINCGDSSVNWSYYRDIPASATGIVNTSPLTSILQLPSTANIGPTSPAEVTSGSKAWIAGAVAGPVLGLALVGLGVCFFLRRKKKAAIAPQYGTASMAPIDPSQPPAGVGGYTDAKPQFASSHPGYYSQPGQPDHYAQQGSPQQGGYSTSPQFGFQSATSPPLGGHTHDARYEIAKGAAELGGDISGSAAVAELSSGDVKTRDEGSSGGIGLSTEGHSKHQ